MDATIELLHNFKLLGEIEFLIARTEAPTRKAELEEQANNVRAWILKLARQDNCVQKRNRNK